MLNSMIPFFAGQLNGLSVRISEDDRAALGSPLDGRTQSGASAISINLYENLSQA